MPPSAISGTRCRRRHAGIHTSACSLRHAEAGREPGRAAAAGADAHFDRVDAALGEKPHAVRGGDVAGDELDVGERAAGTRRWPCAITTEWPCAMSMTITSTCALHELGGALEVVAGRADRRADAQPAVRIARRERQPLLAMDVLGGDQADQRAVRVDERQLLDLALRPSSARRPRASARRAR